MSDSFDPLFLPPIFDQIEPDSDAVKFIRNDEQNNAAFFPFGYMYSDAKRKELVENWIGNREPLSSVDAVMWLDSSGKVLLSDKAKNPIVVEDCIFTFSTLRSEVALKDGNYLEIYKKAINGYWERLIRLNTNLFIIRKINEFPFSVFSPGDQNIFFYTTFTNTIEISIVILNSILNDQKSNEIIQILRNKILNEYIRKEFQESFKKHIKTVNEEANLKEVKDLLARLNNLRSLVIAHLLEWRLTDSLPEKRINLDVIELIKLIEVANKLFQSLTFNVEYSLQLIDYNENVIYNQPYQTDIEDILDAIAKKSDRLNLPEEFPYQWERLRPMLEQSDIDVINKYRMKFGLPPA